MIGWHGYMVFGLIASLASAALMWFSPAWPAAFVNVFIGGMFLGAMAERK